PPPLGSITGHRPRINPPPRAVTASTFPDAALVHPMTSRTNRAVAGYRFQSTVQLMVPTFVHIFPAEHEGLGIFSCVSTE
ncbi:hypothetical protein, partial [Nocardia sp. NPDC058666]|uniref:hypothetical protein n=1 Tax=Nocardia sp. NPDC058666 TaxID=3346587 RepID=UPI00364DFD1A